MYEYEALVTKVYDGDTITVDIDLGFNSWIRNEKVRLARINTPEVRGVERPQGLVSRDWLRGQILGKVVILKTTKGKKKGKYGRYLADIIQGSVCINDALVELGLAEYKSY